MRQAGTWDPWLQSLHLNTRLLQQQNTKKLHGTKNNHMHAQLGQILDPKDTETNKPTVTFEEPGAKTGGQEQKQGPTHAPCTQPHPRGRQRNRTTPWA